LGAEKILIVDDEESIREVLASLLEACGYECATAANGAEAIKQLDARRFDLVLSDILMPVMDGLVLLQKLHEREPDLPVVMVTAMHDISAAIGALRTGAYDYVLKPFERDELYFSVRRALEHRRLVIENRNYQSGLEILVQERTAQLSHALRDLEKSYDYTLEAFAGALDLRDAETEGHCQRVTKYTVLIARSMGIAEPGALRHLARGAFLHDIGKMGIPDNILRKPGPLTEEEWQVMRRHTEIGYAALRNIPFLRQAAEIVLTHQERYDGQGYPKGLRGEEIPLGARIFAVADAFDAMISERPYRRPIPIEAARAEILRHAQSQFDPRVVEVFLALPPETWWKVRGSPGGAFRLTELERSDVAAEAAPSDSNQPAGKEEAVSQLPAPSQSEQRNG
jgi:putative nucleotidyltransferase with HDIG domain